MKNIEFTNAHDPHWSSSASAMTRDYFYWMNDQIEKTCMFSISDVVGMPLDSYVTTAANYICPQDQAEAKFYLLVQDKNPVAMGGLRQLPCGDAEVVRIYTKPEHRGHGYGRMMLQRLISDARTSGFKKLNLDTGIFMKDAQKMYQSHGFIECKAYEGAEPPARLVPYWLFMELDLS